VQRHHRRRHPLPHASGYVDLDQRALSLQVFRLQDPHGEPHGGAGFPRGPRMGFVEVETPVFHPIPAAPGQAFVTQSQRGWTATCFLRIGPPLYLKRLGRGRSSGCSRSPAVFRNDGPYDKANNPFHELERCTSVCDYRLPHWTSPDRFWPIWPGLCGTTPIPYCLCGVPRPDPAPGCVDSTSLVR